MNRDERLALADECHRRGSDFFHYNDIQELKKCLVKAAAALRQSSERDVGAEPGHD